MADTLLLGLFDHVTPAAEAIDALRQEGIEDRDVTVMSNVPYSHKILGRKPPRQMFGLFVLGGALTGLALGAFVAAITPRLYPIEVGGQGLTPVPPSAIIMFEFTALFSMLAVFAGFLFQGQFPALKRRMYDARITEGYIGVLVQAGEAAADRVEKVFKAHGAHDVRREAASDYPSQGKLHLLFWAGLGAAGLVAMLIPLLLTYDIVRVPWINGMVDSPAVGFQQGPRFAVPAESVPVQGPVLIAGQPATAPLPASPESLERGQTLFATNCSMCHGLMGGGDGPVTKYFPETPMLTGDRITDLSDNDIFMVITNGKNRMPGLAENLNPGETWDIVNYVRSLASQAP